MKIIVSLFLCTITFLLLDISWISLVIKNLYSHHFTEGLQQPHPQIGASILAYICIIGGIYTFGVYSSTDALRALIFGGLFGLFAYGTYAFTNVAIFTNWPFNIAFTEVIGGTVNCALASCVTVYFRNLWF